MPRKWRKQQLFRSRYGRSDAAGWPTGRSLAGEENAAFFFASLGLIVGLMSRTGGKQTFKSKSAKS